MRVCWRVRLLLPLEEFSNIVTSLFLYEWYVGYSHLVWTHSTLIVISKESCKIRRCWILRYEPDQKRVRQLLLRELLLLEEALNKVTFLFPDEWIVGYLHLVCIIHSTLTFHFEGKLQDSSLLNIALQTRSRTSSPATPIGRRLGLSKFSRLASERGTHLNEVGISFFF